MTISPRRTSSILFAMMILCAAPTRAQEEERPRVGPFVIDLRGAFLKPPTNTQLSESRGLTSEADLPAFGLGGVAGIHVYPLKWRAITFGIGGEVVIARGRHNAVAVAGQPTGTSVTERFVSAAPQLSFNFRGSNGWSYISGGIGQSVWQIVPDGQEVSSADEERLRTVNYGGGARWFIKKHLAFSLDVRIWQVDPGSPHFGFPGSPRANMLVISAGIGMK
jgi:hypothetical protein